MLGGICFAFYNQNFPFISYSSCIFSNKNRISEVVAGIVRKAQIFASGLCSKVTGEVQILILALPAPRPLLYAQSEPVFNRSNHYCDLSQQP